MERERRLTPRLGALWTSNCASEWTFLGNWALAWLYCWIKLVLFFSLGSILFIISNIAIAIAIAITITTTITITIIIIIYSFIYLNGLGIQIAHL